jgi:mRNA interferase MazF
MPRRSWLKPSQVRTLAVERLGRRIGRVSPEALAQAVEGLFEIVGD